MLLQTQSPALRPLTTAHLAQTMSLLELNSEELRQKIESELASNPALEMMDEYRCPTCHRRLPASHTCPVCSGPTMSTSSEPIIFISPRTDFAAQRQYSDEIDNNYEEWTAEIEDLPTHVMRQIALELDQSDRIIAAHILTSLDEDGLLRTSKIDIARYHHVSASLVENVIRIIQHADPTGVASHTPQEALLVQLEVLAETRPVPELATRAIQEGMNFLSRRSFYELGRLLGISAKQAKRIADFITDNLNPYPARSHWGEPHSTSPNQVYTNPDVIISFLYENKDSPLVVEIVSPYFGSLRVNPLFKEALNQAPDEKTDQWQADLERATLLVKCLQQRNHTLVRLMQRMVVLQKEFIIHGDAFMQPITRARLALELDVHESTVSRAVSDKAVQLPNKRIIPLAKLFDRSLHVRTALREIVSLETKPLSDTQIAELLIKQGFPVARRTVAKYRAMEGILPARFRNTASYVNLE